MLVIVHTDPRHQHLPLRLGRRRRNLPSLPLARSSFGLRRELSFDVVHPGPARVHWEDDEYLGDEGRFGVSSFASSHSGERC